MSASSRQLTFQLSGGPPYGIRLQGGENCPFVVFKVRPASKAEAIGIQEGDVIVAINGISSHGLSHSALTTLMDSVNTTLNVLVLRGPTAFSDVENVQRSLGSQLTTLNESQISSLVGSQPEMAILSSDTGVPNWSGTTETFRLQPVDGKQWQKQKPPISDDHYSQPTDVVSFSSQTNGNPNNFYSRDEHSFDDNGITRRTVQETERKKVGGTTVTTVTRREFSTNSTNTQDGPQFARDFFQSDLFPSSISGVEQDWFGEHSADRTFQTRTVDHFRDPNELISHQKFTQQQQQSLPTSAWNDHRGNRQNATNSVNTTNSYHESTQRFMEPQIRIYPTPGVKQTQNIVIPEFNISIESGQGSGPTPRAVRPIVTVTPAEEHDKTLTLVGPPVEPNLQQQNHTMGFHGQTVKATPPVVSQDYYDPPNVASQSYYDPPKIQTMKATPPVVSQGYYDPPNVASHSYYDPPKIQTVKATPPVASQSYHDPPNVQRNFSDQTPHKNWQQEQRGTAVRDYHQYPPAAEVTLHEPVQVRIVATNEDHQSQLAGQIGNISVSVGDRSHFTKNPASYDTITKPNQPYQTTHEYDREPAYLAQSTPVEDVYHNLYQTNHFAHNPNDNQQFEQRSRPAPATYGQPYQQVAAVSYNQTQTNPESYRVGNLVNKPAGPNNSFHPPSASTKIGNKLPMNPLFKKEADVQPSYNEANYQAQVSYGYQDPQNIQQYDQQYGQPNNRNGSQQHQGQSYEPVSYGMSMNQTPIRSNYPSQPAASHLNEFEPMTATQGWNQPMNSWTPPVANSYHQQFQQNVPGQYHGTQNNSGYGFAPVDVMPPSGYSVVQQTASQPSVAPLPPPPPPSAPPAPPPPPSDPFKVYGLTSGSSSQERSQLENKVILANSVAHSVMSPANVNSRGQKMFLRRQQNSHKWTTSGPDPQPEQKAIPSNQPRAGPPGMARQLPTAARAESVERWNTSSGGEQARSAVSLLKRSDSAGKIPTPSEQWTSKPQQAPAGNLGQGSMYRPVKFQFQKQPVESYQQQSQWNQIPPAGGSSWGSSIPAMSNVSVNATGFTDL